MIRGRSFCLFLVVVVVVAAAGVVVVDVLQQPL